MCPQAIKQSHQPSERATVERAEVLQQLASIATDVLGVEADKVVEGTKFKEDLSADSLDLVELVMALEECYDITITEDVLLRIETVGQAIDVVLERLKPSQATTETRV
jgi:acyl carrier protein